MEWISDHSHIEDSLVPVLTAGNVLEALKEAYNLGAKDLAENSKENIEKYSPTTGKHPHVFHSLVKSLYKKTAKEIINSTLKELVK